MNGIDYYPLCQTAFPKCRPIPLRVILLFSPLLVMIGPAVMTAFPDAASGESRLSASSRLRRRPQICQSHQQISVLIEVRRHRGSHKPRVVILFYSYWHEHDAVVCSAKLGDTVQKHRRHLLVSVFDKTEDLEGKTSHLTLPVLENCRLWVFVAAESNEYDTNMHMHTLKMTDLMSRCMLKHSLRSIHLGISL